VNEHGRFGELKRELDAWSVTAAAAVVMFVTFVFFMILLVAISPLLLAAWVYGRFSK